MISSSPSLLLPKPNPPNWRSRWGLTVLVSLLLGTVCAGLWLAGRSVDGWLERYPGWASWLDVVSATAPAEPTPLLRYARAESRLERGDAEGAVREVQQLLSVAPDYPGGHRLLAVALLRAGRVESAVDVLRKAVTSAGHDAELWTLLGEALLRKTGTLRDGETRQALLRAAALYRQPNSPPLRLLTEQLNDWEPELSEVRLEIAEAHLHSGDAVSAYADVGVVLRAEPRHPAALALRKRILEEFARLRTNGHGSAASRPKPRRSFTHDSGQPLNRRSRLSSPVWCL